MRCRPLPMCSCTCSCNNIGAYQVRPDVPRWALWRRLTTRYKPACYACGVYHADRLLKTWNTPPPSGQGGNVTGAAD